MNMTTFPKGADDYYDVEKARELLSREHVFDNAREKDPDLTFDWWRCVLCGYPEGCCNEHPIITCGGCGQSTMRPAREIPEDQWVETM